MDLQVKFLRRPSRRHGARIHLDVEQTALFLVKAFESTRSVLGDDVTGELLIAFLRSQGVPRAAAIATVTGLRDDGIVHGGLQLDLPVAGEQGMDPDVVESVRSRDWASVRRRYIEMGASEEVADTLLRAFLEGLSSREPD